MAISVAGLAVLAFALRALDAGHQSAYMDEATYIQVGRTIMAHQTPPADLVGRDFGSYLWPLLAAFTDRAGGLLAVRLLTAALGTIMVLAVMVFAARCMPSNSGERRRRTVALVAGLVMAVFPTAIAVGRFGTYDALAGAFFMSGIAVLLPARRNADRVLLFAGATLLFVGFLAKYVLAIYFPFLCLYLVFGTRNRHEFVRNTVWFALPLAAACAAYFLLFRSQLFYLFHFSVGYSDLRSDFPLREYLFQRGDLWLLIILALWGLRAAGRRTKIICLAGTGIVLLFQALSRADYDFWKHSIYAVYFLAPLAGLALAPVVEWLIEGALAGIGWRPASGTERVLARAVAMLLILWQGSVLLRGQWGRGNAPFLVLAIVAGLVVLAPPAVGIAQQLGRSRLALGFACVLAVVAGVTTTLPLAHAEVVAQSLVDFYPNLEPSQGAIQKDVRGSHVVLADDSAVRYYLRDEISYGQVIDPFYFKYRGAGGVAAYRQAIGDRYFDAIVLDGGVGPQGKVIRDQLGDEIAQNYDRVYSKTSAGGTPSGGTTVEIFKARTTEAAAADVSGSEVTYFDSGVQGWGAHPGSGAQQAGLDVAISNQQPWLSHNALKFTASGDASLVSTALRGPVSKVQVDVYVVPPSDAKSSSENATATIGMIGFDGNWAWRDDGFQQAVPFGRWEHLTWQLQAPGVYNEIGLKLPDGKPWTVYIGRVAVQP